MLFCSNCSKHYTALHSFFVEDKDYLSKKIEFRRCPQCGTPLYKETVITFKNAKITKDEIRGERAVKLFQRAYFNRLVFLEKLAMGSKANQNWFFGDFEKTNKKDEKGNFLFRQLKRNFNNQIVEDMGIKEVIYG